MRYDLDGIYFRIKTDDGYDNICFSDLTPEQQDEVLKNKNENYLREMCKSLAKTLKTIGEQFDIVAMW